MRRRLDPRHTAEEFLRSFIITIDGPSGSGKTTTARLIAQRLGLRHVDTGAMYRAVTLLASERGVDPGDAERLGELASGLEINLAAGTDQELRIFIGDRDVTDDIRDPRITAAVSAVSAHRAVRAAMVRRQRQLADKGGVVLEGRDIGSVVLPWADLKIYLDAVVRVRAQRRTAELARAGVNAAVDDVARELDVRDTLDASREASPLQRPVGAFLVDTSETTIEEQVARVVDLAQSAAQERARARALTTPSQRIRPAYWATCMFVQVVFRLLWGMRIKSVLRTDPAQHYLFASNHISYFDPPAVSVTLPREVHFVAKDTLFKIWWLGRVIRFYNAFPIKRGVFDREAMGHALTLLQSNKSVLIFPEGGRVAGGKLGEARSGVGYLAIRSGAPVVPVYVEGTDRLKDCFFRRTRVRVVHGKPIRIPAELLAGYQSDDDRALYRRYSEMIIAAIQALKDARINSA